MTHQATNRVNLPLSDCDHYGAQYVEGTQPQANVCQECGLEGPLRMCATCGYVGCCESRASHDTLHWEKTGHAIIRRMPLADDSFTWCYEHKAYLK